MTKVQALLMSFCAATLLVGVPAVSSAQDKDTPKKDGKAAGILIEKKEKWVVVKVDGDEEPVKYLIGDAPDKKLTESLKSTFDACRVELTYKPDGDARQLVGIKRQILKASGTMTGTVVKVHNEFWVEVKPANGVADAFAPSGANYKNKDFMDTLKGLQKGDTVTITYTTDFERHRIETLKKK